MIEGSVLEFYAQTEYDRTWKAEFDARVAACVPADQIPAWSVGEAVRKAMGGKL